MIETYQLTFLLKDTFILNSVLDPAVADILKLIMPLEWDRFVSPHNVCVDDFSTNMNVFREKKYSIQLRLNKIVMMDS